VAESGIENGADIGVLRAVGYSAFLVGESLMRAPSLGKRARLLAEAHWSQRVIHDLIKICGITNLEDAEARGSGADALGFRVLREEPAQGGPETGGTLFAIAGMLRR